MYYLPPKFGLNLISYPSNILAIVCVTFSSRLAAISFCSLKHNRYVDVCYWFYSCNSTILFWIIQYPCEYFQMFQNNDMILWRTFSFIGTFIKKKRKSLSSWDISIFYLVYSKYFRTRLYFMRVCCRRSFHLIDSFPVCFDKLYLNLEKSIKQNGWCSYKVHRLRNIEKSFVTDI